MKLTHILLSPFLPRVADPSPTWEAIERLRQARLDLMATAEEVRRIIDEESREASSGS